MELRPTAIAQALDQLASRQGGPLAERAPANPVPAKTDENTERPALRRSSFSGSGLDLELTLKSGQRINLDIRVNQTGGLSELSLSSGSELTDADEARLQNFLSELSHSVNQLFRGDASGADVFDFSNQAGISDIEFHLFQDDGNKKQILQFDKDGSGLNKKIDAQLYVYDRIADIEDEHSMVLSSEQNDEHRFPGALNYQWLSDQIRQATSVVEDKETGNLMAGFFQSGLRALFETSHAGSALLQELGATASEARRVIASGIKTLVAENTGNPDAAGNEQQLNGLPGFSAKFSSQRVGKGEEGSHFQFNMTLSQSNFAALDAGSETFQEVQNRRLRAEYESARKHAVMEYLWVRDESVRTVFKDNALSSTHYRISESHQLTGQEDQQYKDREDQYYSSP